MTATRYVVHFALWLIGVPWPACTVWIWAQNIASPSSFQSVTDSLAGLAVCGFLGLYGTVVCLLITFPSAVVTCVVFSFAPRTLTHPLVPTGFVVTTAVLGTWWAKSTGSSLGMGREDYGLLLIGFVAGLVLGCLTVVLWTTGAGRVPTEAASDGTSDTCKR
jgi:hypothetical protein